MGAELLRLSHRKERDKRLTTHIFLSCRILGIYNIYYTGDKDEKLEKNINKVEKNWGKCLNVQHIKKPLKLIEEKKKEGYTIVHLTMYGIPYKQKINEIKKLKNILIIIGSEKVPSEIYKLSDYNISIGNQPHSELTALVILSYELNNCKLKECSVKSLYRIIPQEKGKKVVRNDK